MRLHSRRLWLIFGLIAVVFSLALASPRQAESLGRRSVAAGAAAEARGAAAFEGAGFGGVSADALSTNAVPWRIAAAALVLDEQARSPSAPVSLATLNAVLARFGFLPAARIINMPAGVGPRKSGLPLGFTYGDVAPIPGAKVRVANLGCAACHAGVSYGPDGAPHPDQAVIGMPNSSIDLEAYTTAVLQALRRQAGSERLIPAAQRLFPDMDWRETLTARLLVMPLVRQRLEMLAGADRPLSFPNGAPGATNGVAALKAALKLPLSQGGAGEVGFVSIPDLSDHVWRTSLLADGAYAAPGAARQSPTTSAALDAAHLKSLAAIATFFTVPSMGVHPDRAHDSLGDAEEVMAFLKAYRPQAFPGPIDPEAAARGGRLYADACANCHGAYDAGERPRLIRFPNWLGDAGTDPTRARVFDAGLAAGVSKTSYADVVSARSTGLYAAPPLAGVWASAPYLHNGSVPTLAALLSPETRPDRFMVGGHALDFERVGLRLDAAGAYPAGYRPFANPAWIDTRRPGWGNQGHRFGEALSPPEKRDLIAYLKGL